MSPLASLGRNDRIVMKLVKCSTSMSRRRAESSTAPQRVNVVHNRSLLERVLFVSENALEKTTANVLRRFVPVKGDGTAASILCVHSHWAAGPSEASLHRSAIATYSPAGCRTESCGMCFTQAPVLTMVRMNEFCKIAG